MAALCRLLLLPLLLGLACSAASAPQGAQTVVHMLDYVAVDYPESVRDGKVLNDAEYKEQQEFAAQIAEQLGKLASGPQQAGLQAQAAALKSRIDAKAGGDEIAQLARTLRWNVIGAFKLAVAPRSAPDLGRGAQLFEAQCAACHGREGRGDGLAAKGLDPAPSNFHDRARMVQRSLYGLYSTITLGVEGTAMQSYQTLSDEDRWNLAFYVGAMRYEPAALARGEELWRSGKLPAELGTLGTIATLAPAEIEQRYGADGAAAFAWLAQHPTAGVTNASPIDYARRLLGESRAAYRAGDTAQAQRLALDAYLEGFELVESTLDTVDRNLRAEIEQSMIAYRELIRQQASTERVLTEASRIDGLLAAASEKLAGEEGLSPYTAAVSAYFILVREGLEALLVVAAIIALLVKTGRREALPWIHLGWIGALALGLATWVVASTLVSFSGATRELTEGITGLIAAALLLYVGLWLHGKSHARAWQAFVDRHLQSALRGGTLWALAGISFLAVYREAFETVLFYQALWQQAGPGSQGSIMAGFGGAAATLLLLGWAIPRFGMRLPLGLVFGVSALLMAALAVVFTGSAVHGLQEAGVLVARPVHTPTLPMLGIYPTAESLVAQLAMLTVVVAAFAWQRQRARAQGEQNRAPASRERTS